LCALLAALWLEDFSTISSLQNSLFYTTWWKRESLVHCPLSQEYVTLFVATHVFLTFFIVSHNSFLYFLERKLMGKLMFLYTFDLVKISNSTSFCIPESLNMNISHYFFDYKITFGNSQHENTNYKCDFVLKSQF
jgi:hypothetical protein